MNARRVLIIDDNDMNIQLVSVVLNAGGFVVEGAVDAVHARQKIPRFEPDLILMDIQLPGTDGVALTRELKADPATRHIPIVAFTAYAMKGDEARFREAGCDGYIAKPIQVGKLAAQIGAYLEDTRSA